MAQYKSKADKAFDKQLEFLLGEARVKPKLEGTTLIASSTRAAQEYLREQARPLPLDADAVESLFYQYGCYLELISEPEKDPAPVLVPRIPAQKGPSE